VDLLLAGPIALGQSFRRMPYRLHVWTCAPKGPANIAAVEPITLIPTKRTLRRTHTIQAIPTLGQNARATHHPLSKHPVADPVATTTPLKDPALLEADQVDIATLQPHLVHCQVAPNIAISHIVSKSKYQRKPICFSFILIEIGIQLTLY